uniref:Uncharacterized protein n=1 Tax=Ciona intestinalis TaxID=7719 RepID=H2XQS3_CIOIN
MYKNCTNMNTIFAHPNNYKHLQTVKRNKYIYLCLSTGKLHSLITYTPLQLPTH